MRIFKFGGASVKDAGSIKNLAKIVTIYRNEPLLVVISAMGKTTNALEEILRAAIGKQPIRELVESLRNYHLNIINDLFPKAEDASFVIVKEVQALFEQLMQRLEGNVQEENYNQLYDAIISNGEIISTKIVAAYLNYSDIPSEWIDAREHIKTDSTYREGRVDWQETEILVNPLRERLDGKLLVTQGFIGSNAEGITTTLGREGSDFSAAIFASCLNAQEVVVWKDVPGILNADPKLVTGAIKYEELPYQEAAEMTFYGASVIHPKTIKPLANKKIPLWVRPFNDVEATGTCIHDCEVKDLPPAIIFKPNQCLISFKVKDFTFISEKNLSQIFHVLDELDIKINLMQNSAISFSICVDNREDKISKLLQQLNPHFYILYNEQLILITVKNYTLEVIKDITEETKILLEQRTRNNFQIVVKE